MTIGFGSLSCPDGDADISTYSCEMGPHLQESGSAVLPGVYYRFFLNKNFISKEKRERKCQKEKIFMKSYWNR